MTNTECIANSVYDQTVAQQHPEVILQHALVYLEPYGLGRDLEYNRARCILQYALAEVKRG